MKFRRACGGVYRFCVTIPDHLYPFVEEIEGERVRWKRAYDAALMRLQLERGYGSYGVRFIAYRGFFHVLGAVLFILFATLISRDLFGTDTALYVLFVLATLALLYQEFYIQRKTFGQMRAHAVADFVSWTAPFLVYVFIHLT